MTLNRRELLSLTAASVAAAALPTLPSVASTPAPVNLKAWAVGTPGEFDWQHIIAETEDQARRYFAAEVCGGDSFCEEGGADDCECEFCISYGSSEAERKPMWDGMESPKAGDWLRAGLGTMCSRCSYETFPHDGGNAIGDEAVCEECMTLADWNIVDPEHAAELRERMISRGHTLTLMGRNEA